MEISVTQGNLSDSAVFRTKDERSYDLDSLLFITVFFKADGALYSKPPNRTFSPEFKESQQERGLGREWGGGRKKNKHKPTALGCDKVEVYLAGEMVRDRKDPVERYLHTHSCTNCLIFISSVTT